MCISVFISPAWLFCLFQHKADRLVAVIYTLHFLQQCLDKIRFLECGVQSG